MLFNLGPHGPLIVMSSIAAAIAGLGGLMVLWHMKRTQTEKSAYRFTLGIFPGPSSGHEEEFPRFWWDLVIGKVLIPGAMPWVILCLSGAVSLFVIWTAPLLGSMTSPHRW